jgi:pilus assembly protein CpaE
VLLLSVGGPSAEEIVALLEQSGMTVSIAHDFDAAMHRLSEHELVILDAADEAAVILLCRRINDAAGHRHPPILAIAHEDDVEARVRLLEAGADDVLARPIDDRELEAIVEALLLRTSSPVPSAAPGEAPSATAGAPSGPGRVIAFAAAKGGSGTTTLAVNTALLLADMAHGNVALADLDMLHGQVATHLDIYSRVSTAALAREEFTGLGSEMLHESGKRHSTGLTVFGGPYRPDEAADISGEQLGRLVDALRNAYGTVIIDAGSTFDIRALTVLGRADAVCFVLTPDIPSLRLLKAALEMLTDSGAAAERTVYVVNDIYPKPMIGPVQIEEHLGLKVGHQVPYDGESFVKAINEGRPYVLMSRRSPGAVAIRSLAESLSDGSPSSVEPVEPQRRKGLRGFLNRGS